MVRDLIAEKVRATDGRISAKRLLPSARAADYGGSTRNHAVVIVTEGESYRMREAKTRGGRTNKRA